MTRASKNFNIGCLICETAKSCGTAAVHTRKVGRNLAIIEVVHNNIALSVHLGKPDVQVGVSGRWRKAQQGNSALKLTADWTGCLTFPH